LQAQQLQRERQQQAQVQSTYYGAQFQMAYRDGVVRGKYEGVQEGFGRGFADGRAVGLGDGRSVVGEKIQAEGEGEMKGDGGECASASGV
jgi:hypothetical protein